MPAQFASLADNYLLGSLSPGDFALLKPLLEPIQLPRHFVLERPQEPAGHVYFPSSGLASIVIYDGRDRQVETGLFGREGMSGTAVVMGSDCSSQQCFMQAGGEGQRVSSKAMQEAMDASPTLRLSFLRYVQSLQVQTQHTALANAQARLDRRLCRWLLMCHDRIDGDDLPVIHAFLAKMLSVRRAGVTTAVQMLQGRGLIQALRGSIRILDRAGLETCADGTYGLPEAEYERLVGVSFRSTALKSDRP